MQITFDQLSPFDFLLFGYRGNRNPLRPYNDGVVTLATQLDSRAQVEARMVFGFEEDHGSILESERVADVMTDILRQVETAANLIEPNKGAPLAGANAPRVSCSAGSSEKRAPCSSQASSYSNVTVSWPRPA